MGEVICSWDLRLKGVGAVQKTIGHHLYFYKILAKYCNVYFFIFKIIKQNEKYVNNRRHLKKKLYMLPF